MLWYTISMLSLFTFDNSVQFNNSIQFEVSIESPSPPAAAPDIYEGAQKSPKYSPKCSVRKHVEKYL